MSFSERRRQMPALTKTFIDKLKWLDDGPTKQIYWDESTRGFGIKVLKSGAKMYMIKYKRHGKTFTSVLGKHGILTPTQAKTKAIEELNLGKSGLKHSGKSKISPTDELTFQELSELYMKHHAIMKVSGQRDQEKLNNDILPKLGKMKVHQINHYDVQDIFDKKTKDGHPVAANRLRALISKIYEFGKSQKVIQTILVKYEYVNPASHVNLNPEESRERFLTQEEMSIAIDTMNQEPNPIARDAMFFLLYSGARKNSILQLRWEHVDFQNEMIVIKKLSRTFNNKGKTYTIEMNSKLKEILENIPRDGSPYVFPSPTSASGHLMDIKSNFKRVKQAIGDNNITIHDMRRTFGSWIMSEGDISKELLAEMLGHSPNSTATEIYGRFDKTKRTPRREAMEKFIDLTKVIRRKGTTK